MSRPSADYAVGDSAGGCDDDGDGDGSADARGSDGGDSRVDGDDVTRGFSYLPGAADDGGVDWRGGYDGDRVFCVPNTELRRLASCDDGFANGADAWSVGGCGGGFGGD